MRGTQTIRGTLKHNEPLAQYTSWHIGGNAARYYKPADLIDLIEFLKTLPPTEPITWLGLGSNVLINDTTIPGTVIHTQGALNNIFKVDPNKAEKTDQIPAPAEIQNIIYAEAGIPCAKLAKLCAKEGLSGGAFFVGIPGTIGGALYMNAGAFGGETWNHVLSVETVDKSGNRKTRTAKDFQIGYRSVKPLFKVEEWFLSAQFKFESGDAQKAATDIKQLLKKRSDTQPIGVFSCGSVFQNPPNDYAARLIESCGLKGYQIGDAQISPKHANFIINLENARAKDVVELIKLIQNKVFETHHVQLKTEVKFIGFENSL